MEILNSSGYWLLDKRFIFFKHLVDDALGIFAKMLLCFFVQLIRVDGLAVFHHNLCRTDFREMCFENICGVVDGNGDDRTFCLGGDFEASLMEGEHIQVIFVLVSGALREDTDGNAGFDLIYSCQDGFQSLLDVLSVQEEAVEIFHPGGQERDFLHFLFGNVAGADRAAAVGEEDVKVASVITDIQDRGVLRYIFLSYYCDFGSCDPQDKSKYSLNDPKRADILGHRRKFADDPFYQ